MQSLCIQKFNLLSYHQYGFNAKAAAAFAMENIYSNPGVTNTRHGRAFCTARNAFWEFSNN